MTMNVFGKHYGLVVIVVMCGLGSLFNYHLKHKSEPLKPTTIIEAPKVGSEVESETIAPDDVSPLGTFEDPFKHKQTEEEVIAAITRNACLKRCPSGTVPVFIGDEVVGFFDFELSTMTRFSLGERLNL